MVSPAMRNGSGKNNSVFSCFGRKYPQVYTEEKIENCFLSAKICCKNKKNFNS
jgi:hypothetical protein